MNRLKIVFLFSMLFAFCFTINSTLAFSQKISSIELSKNKIKLPCLPGGCPVEGRICDKDTVIAISVSATKFNNNELTFRYKVSGGQIIGEGSNVLWDLAKTQPGTYKIFAEIQDKTGVSLGKSDTKTITVENCYCIRDCFCPDEISVAGPMQPIKPGETMTFTANVLSGGDATYKWTVSKGKIIEGQGTPSIKVATTPEMAGEEIKATVKSGGEALCSGTCIDEAFAVGKIEKTKLIVDVQSITFDKPQAVLGCERVMVPLEGSYCQEEGGLVKVSTKTTELDDNELEYYYFVSGGKIVGQGANVVWDFRYIRPGNYTITVGIGKDFVIWGKTLSKTIELDECICDPPCECPNGVKILGPTTPIKIGDLIVLETEVSSGKESININWKISNGTIVSGQRTSQILVKVDSVMNDSTLEASVEVYNDCAECTPVIASRSIQIIKQK